MLHGAGHIWERNPDAPAIPRRIVRQKRVDPYLLRDAAGNPILDANGQTQRDVPPGTAAWDTWTDEFRAYVATLASRPRQIQGRGGILREASRQWHQYIKPGIDQLFRKKKLPVDPCPQPNKRDPDRVLAPPWVPLPLQIPSQKRNIKIYRQIVTKVINAWKRRAANGLPDTDDPPERRAVLRRLERQEWLRRDAENDDNDEAKAEAKAPARVKRARVPEEGKEGKDAAGEGGRRKRRKVPYVVSENHYIDDMKIPQASLDMEPIEPAIPWVEEMIDSGTFNRDHIIFANETDPDLEKIYEYDVEGGLKAGKWNRQCNQVGVAGILAVKAFSHRLVKNFRGRPFVLLVTHNQQGDLTYLPSIRLNPVRTFLFLLQQINTYLAQHKGGGPNKAWDRFVVGISRDEDLPDEKEEKEGKASDNNNNNNDDDRKRQGPPPPPPDDDQEEEEPVFRRKRRNPLNLGNRIMNDQSAGDIVPFDDDDMLALSPARPPGAAAVAAPAAEAGSEAKRRTFLPMTNAEYDNKATDINAAPPGEAPRSAEAIAFENKHGVTIRQSLVPGAGWGVFATKRLRKGLNLPFMFPNQAIKLVNHVNDLTAHEQNYDWALGHHDNPRLFLRLENPFKSSFGRFVNAADNPDDGEAFSPNAEIVTLSPKLHSHEQEVEAFNKGRRPKVILKLLEAVQPGEEILTTYGEDYWQDRAKGPQNPASIKKAAAKAARRAKQAARSKTQKRLRF